MWRENLFNIQINMRFQLERHTYDIMRSSRDVLLYVRTQIYRGSNRYHARTQHIYTST